MVLKLTKQKKKTEILYAIILAGPWDKKSSMIGIRT